MHNSLVKDFNQWVKQAYKMRKLDKVSRAVAKDGGNSWNGRDLFELYRLKKERPDLLDQALQDFDKANKKPSGWAAAQFAEMEKRLDEEYEKGFADDQFREQPKPETGGPQTK
jgi:hypothetical protein